MRKQVSYQMLVLIGLFSLAGCSAVKGTYNAVAGTVKGIY